LTEAAAEIFNSAGYHATDTNRIARAAGYAPGTFYTHFADKRAIFLEVYRGWVDAEIQALVAALEPAANKAGLRLRLARIILDHHQKWRVFRASLRALYATDEVVHEARLAERQRQIDTFIELFRARGATPPSRARALASLLAVEILCDAAADGDAKKLGADEAELLNIIAAHLALPEG
jgi:AcrR family transcriptional regulator